MRHNSLKSQQKHIISLTENRMSLKKDRQTPSLPFFHHSGPEQLFTQSCQIIPSESEPSSPVTRNHCLKSQQTSLNMLVDDSKQLKKNPLTVISKSSLFLPVALHPTPTDETTQEICSSNESQAKLCKLDSSGTFSTLRNRLMQSNQYIAGLHTRYTSQINNLNKISKDCKQKLSQYGGVIEEVKLENIKKVRELVHIKQRLQLLQKENNNLRIRIKECQSEKKKLHMIILQKENDDNNDQTQEENFKRGRENRQKALKAIIDSMAAGMIELERQKQRIEFQLNQERNMHEEKVKTWEEEMTEQRRLLDHEKEMLLKRINKLESKLKEKVEQLSLLENGHKQLQRSIQFEKNNDEKMRFQVQQLTYELHSLKKSLTFAESSLTSKHKQIKTLAVENEQIRHLKVKIAEKEQLIAILRNKITALQGIIEQLENKCTELQEQMHIVAEDKLQLQQDKKDLMQKIENQKQSITKLISQIQFFQNASEIMNTEFIKKSTYIERQRQELSMVNQQIEKNNQELQFKLKVIQQQLAEEQERSSSIEALVSDLKYKNHQLASEISKLSLERLSLAQTLAKLTEETSGIDHKKSILESQIFQLKSKKEMKESLYFEKIEELSKKEQQMFEQIDGLNRQMAHLSEKIDCLSKQNKQFAHQLEVKERDLQQVHDQLFKMKKEKFKTEETLEAFHCQALSNQVKLHESAQQIQRLNKYIEDLQSHINELDNILVWKLEQGRGESNNFEQRKVKMQQIVILLQQKVKENTELKEQCKDKDESIKQLDNAIGESQSLLTKFTEKLQKFLEEKEILTKMIQDIDVSNKILAEKLTTYKLKEVEWMSKEKALNKKLKNMQERITTTNEQKSMIKGKLQLLEKHVTEKLKEIQQLQLQIAVQKEKNISLKQTVDKLSSQLKKTDNAAVKKAKELARQIDVLKIQVEEKSGYLSQVQLDAKQQINHLNFQLTILKNEMRDFSTFYQGQKFNYTKRNLFLVDLATTFGKFQKANCIKSHHTHPVKEILKKMEQLDNYSSKLFTKYAKFQGRKEY